MGTVNVRHKQHTHTDACICAYTVSLKTCTSLPVVSCMHIIKEHTHLRETLIRHLFPNSRGGSTMNTHTHIHINTSCICVLEWSQRVAGHFFSSYFPRDPLKVTKWLKNTIGKIPAQLDTINTCLIEVKV